MYQVDAEKKMVKFTHRSKAKDGVVELTTTFDMSQVPMEKMLLWAATNRLATYRLVAQISKMPMSEAKKLDNQIIDCRRYIEKAVRTMSVEEKEVTLKARDLMRKKGMSAEQIMQKLEEMEATML